MWDGTARVMDVIWGKREGKYFCGWDWTGRIALIGFDKFAVARKFRKPLSVASAANLASGAF
jgi:hypothetical protein